MQRRLQNWLKTYLQYTSYNEAPTVLHFWAGVGAIASALRRCVWLSQEYYIWSPNFYIIFVAPPGVSTKSTVLSISKSIVGEVGGIKFGPNAITWQALTASMSQATQAIMMPDQLMHSMSCLTFYASEFGTLLDPQDRRMIDVLVDLWDGQTGVWEKETKTSGNDRIINPWLTIIAGTTPTWLADNIPKTMIYGGFTSRCVFVYADTKRQLIPYPKDVMPDSIKALKDDLIHDLQLISGLRGEFVMTPEAKKFGTDWYFQHHESHAKVFQQDEGMSGYFARKQGHLHKLAMVLAVAQRSDLVIDVGDLQAALVALDDVEKDLPRVFAALRTGKEMEHLSHIISRIVEIGATPKDELYRQYLHVMPERVFNELLSSAVSADVLKIVQRGATFWVELGGKAVDTLRSCQPSGETKEGLLPGGYLSLPGSGRNPSAADPE